MRSFLFLILIIFGPLLPLEVSAYSPKEGNVLGTLGFFLHRTNFLPSTTGAEAPWQGGIALVANGDVSTRGQLEVGIFHMNKQYFRDLNYRFIGEQTEELHVTMGYRHWIMPSFSAAISFSTAYSMGYVHELHNDFYPSPAIDTSAHDTVEYGFDFSLQAEVYKWDRYAIMFDAIYSLSVTGKPNERANHYGGLLGLRYFIQEKQIVEKPKTAI